MELLTLHLCSGAGGGIIADAFTGHRPIGAVEIEADARTVILCRQLDGILPGFPLWDDLRSFSIKNPECTAYFEYLRRYRDRLCIAGGFPCQDISAAGKGAGIDGARSSLWWEHYRIICEVRPRFVFLENSPLLTSRGLHRILGALAHLGYDAEWGVLSAAAVGAPHLRKRIWVVAHTHGQGLEEWDGFTSYAREKLTATE